MGWKRYAIDAIDAKTAKHRSELKTNVILLLAYEAIIVWLTSKTKSGAEFSWMMAFGLFVALLFVLKSWWAFREAIKAFGMRGPAESGVIPSRDFYHDLHELITSHWVDSVMNTRAVARGIIEARTDDWRPEAIDAYRESRQATMSKVKMWAIWSAFYAGWGVYLLFQWKTTTQLVAAVVIDAVFASFIAWSGFIYLRTFRDLRARNREIRSALPDTKMNEYIRLMMVEQLAANYHVMRRVAEDQLKVPLDELRADTVKTCPHLWSIEILEKMKAPPRKRNGN